MERLSLAVTFAAALAVLMNTAALAQSSRGQAAGPADVNGITSMTIDDSGMRLPAKRNGTTGVRAGSGPEQGSPNGSPAAPPKATTGPNGMPSSGETSPK